MYSTFTEGVDKFVAAIEVTPEVAPMVVTMQRIAETLDEQDAPSGALVSAFITAWRQVIRQTGKSTEGVSEAEDFLNSL